MKMTRTNSTSEDPHALPAVDMVDTDNDIYGIYAPYANEPTTEGNSPVHVAIDDKIVEVVPDTGIGDWDTGAWYKELVITYGVKAVTNCTNFLFDNDWIGTVWNNMGRRYKAFLKNINTQRRTLRFSVLTETYFRRLKLKAKYSLNELQTEMMKGTCSDVFLLKEIAEAKPVSPAACIDSGLETDSITSSNCSLGEHDVFTLMKGIQADLRDIKEMKGIQAELRNIKESIYNLHSCKCTARRTTPPKTIHIRSHTHPHQQTPNKIRGHSLTSMDEDILEMPNHSDKFSSKPDQPMESRIKPYGHVQNRNHCDTEFAEFQPQETPGSQILPFNCDTYESRPRRKNCTDSNDDDFEDTCVDKSLNKQRAMKTKRNQIQHKRRKKVQGRPGVSLVNQSLQHDVYKPVFRSSVKVLKPRSIETAQEQRSAESSFADSESAQNKPEESTINILNKAFNQNQLAGEIPKVEPQQDLLLETDRNQRIDEDSAIQNPHRQVGDTERQENAKDGRLSTDDQLLLERTIFTMEQDGDLDLETDGIDDSALLQILGRKSQDVTNETVRTEQDEVWITEIDSHHQTHSDGPAVNPQLDIDVSLVSSSTSGTGSQVTDTATSADVGDPEVDDALGTITLDDPGWSLDSDHSSQPGVDAEKMLRNVGLATNPPLIQVLNENKNSIENSSHGAKGNGIDTVLLVDASSSMDEKSFEQTKSACHSIVEFVESVAAEKSIEENLALVVFGRTPMILQHLTMDYRKLYDKIETIEPGGSSPMCLGTLLSMLELHLRGGTTSIARYQIPPRVIMFTDGRPTDDTRFQHQEIEFAVKSPTVKETVLLAMDEMRHYGYKVHCVPVGQAINRTFIAEMVGRADGSIVEIDDLSTIKKHFLLHYTIAKVIGICRDTGFEDQYHKVIGRETAGLVSSTFEGVSFSETDVEMIIRELEKSEELIDIEYPDFNLPPIGSRVSIPADLMSSHSGDSKEYGTVIQHKSNGMIKVEWDAGMFSFLAYNEDKTNLKLDIVREPRRMSKESLIEVGVEVVKAPMSAETESDTLRGRVFLTTSNGYVKVRWDDGSIERHKYGADTTFELHITLDSYAFNAYVWQYHDECGKWITYPLDSQRKLESASLKRNKTAIIRTSRSSGRIKFADMTETRTHANDVVQKRPVRRITVAEMKTNFV